MPHGIPAPRQHSYLRSTDLGCCVDAAHASSPPLPEALRYLSEHTQASLPRVNAQSDPAYGNTATAVKQRGA